MTDKHSAFDVVMAKARVVLKMKEAGLWRDDIEPKWTIHGDEIRCWFPTMWDAPPGPGQQPPEKT